MPLTQSANTCSNCGTGLLVDDSDAPETLQFECPDCGNEYEGYEDRTGDGFVRFVEVKV